jgi:hypothetical protein
MSTPSFTLPSVRQGAFIIGAFTLSILITGLFIRAYDGYVSPESMLLSGSVASAKWAIQMFAGLCLLGEKRWLYSRELATACLIGSLTLLPFALFSGGPTFFFGSLLFCILTMGLVICLRLSCIGLSWYWKALWFILLACAVSLQLTVVFDLI